MRFGILPLQVFRTLQNPVDIRLFHDFEDMERTRSPNVKSNLNLPIFSFEDENLDNYYYSSIWLQILQWEVEELSPP